MAFSLQPRLVGSLLLPSWTLPGPPSLSLTRSAQRNRPASKLEPPVKVPTWSPGAACRQESGSRGCRQKVEAKPDGRLLRAELGGSNAGLKKRTERQVVFGQRGAQPVCSQNPPRRRENIVNRIAPSLHRAPRTRHAGDQAVWGAEQGISKLASVLYSLLRFRFKRKTHSKSSPLTIFKN